MRKIRFIVLSMIISVIFSCNAFAGVTDVIHPQRPLISGNTIFGEDDSTFVAENVYPNTAVAKLYIKFPNDVFERQGTGFLYGDNVLATAAHCLYDARHGGWAEHVRVVFFNGEEKIYIHRIYTFLMNLLLVVQQIYVAIGDMIMVQSSFRAVIILRGEASGCPKLLQSVII